MHSLESSAPKSGHYNNKKFCFWSLNKTNLLVNWKYFKVKFQKSFQYVQEVFLAPKFHFLVFSVAPNSFFHFAWSSIQDLMGFQTLKRKDGRVREWENEKERERESVCNSDFVLLVFISFLVFVFGYVFVLWRVLCSVVVVFEPWVEFWVAWTLFVPLSVSCLLKHFKVWSISVCVFV